MQNQGKLRRFGQDFRRNSGGVGEEVPKWSPGAHVRHNTITWGGSEWWRSSLDKARKYQVKIRTKSAQKIAQKRVLSKFWKFQKNLKKRLDIWNWMCYYGAKLREQSRSRLYLDNSKTERPRERRRMLPHTRSGKKRSGARSGGSYIERAKNGAKFHFLKSVSTMGILYPF